MLNSYVLLNALQNFLHGRGVDVQTLTAQQMVPLMIDWIRLEPVDRLERKVTADVLVHRYGGWSEGCATGFRYSVLRRVSERADDGTTTEWFAGVTLMFEPSRLAGLAPLDMVSSDQRSLEAFLEAIEGSAAYKVLAQQAPMSALLESGGVR